MTEPFVADSSATVAWAAAGQATPATDALLRDVEAGRSFVVPSLWIFEVSNALISLVRRRKMHAADCDLARRSIAKLCFVVDDNGPSQFLGPTWELAERYDLTVYDAAYLELAQRRGLALASKDAALNRAAKLCGVKTLL